jgi:hypothetical protein
MYFKYLFNFYELRKQWQDRNINYVNEYLISFYTIILFLGLYISWSELIRDGNDYSVNRLIVGKIVTG